jgi:hypothetical protein
MTLSTPLKAGTSIENFKISALPPGSVSLQASISLEWQANVSRQWDHIRQLENNCFYF